jgi:predicted transcriptional regulator
MDAHKVDPVLTAEIVGSYVRHHTVGASQLPDLIASVHRTLGELGQPNTPEEVLTPAVSVRQSVRPEFVICLDCGYRGRMLRRHINRHHGLTRDEYLKRWGLRHDHPPTAPAHSERRSTLAKELGLGRKATAEATPAPTPKVSASLAVDRKSEAKAALRGRPRSASKSAVVNDVVPVVPMPVRQRRPRSRVSSRQSEQTPKPTAET